MSGTKLKNSRYYITQNNIFLGKKTASTSVEGSSSNLQKIKETEHEEEGASLQEFVFEQANKFFIDHIPIETIKDLPNTYLYFFGTVAHLLAMLLFIYFVYNNYSQAVSEAYISLTTDGGDCNTVPISITGTYLADYNGNWAGTPEYEESLALYQLSFSNFEITSELQYNEMMSNFYTNLINIGDKAKTYNLAENLIYWMTYVDYYDIQSPSLTNFTGVGYGQLQTLQLTADPAIVFNLLHNIQRFSSKRGKCPVSSYTTYDQANHIFQSYYSNASQIFQNTNCSFAVNPLTFGYYPTTDGYIYNVGLHMQAIAVALGVNFGIIPFQTLRVISRKVANFTYGRSSYTIGEYYDVRYPTMQTLFCITNATALPPSLSPYQQLCFLATGTTFILPVFNQYGVDITKPVYCDCSDPLLKHNEACSQFNLLTGMLFYHSKDEINLKDFSIKELIHQLRSNVTGVLTEFGLFNLLKLVQLYPSYRAFNRAAYNASFYTIADASHCDEQCWKEVYSFCRLPNSNLTCSLSIVGSETTLLNTVSDYKYQLQNGSCTASMVISESNWAKLVENPPVQFTQIYYECYQPTTSAFITAVGVASGNTQIFIPFFVFGLLPFLYFLLVAIRQVPPKEEYTKAERSDANEILSLLLLRIRDGKTRGIKKQGILQGLAKELIAAAKEEGGYPDSDDEDEETRPDSSPVKHNYDITDKAKTARMILREDSLISVDENTPRDDVSMMRDTEQRQSHSHRRSQQRIRKVPKRNARFRMGVFTKQLKGKYVEEEEEEDHNHHRASNASVAYPRDTMGRETDMNGSDVRETELTRKTTLLERSPTTLNGGTSRFESESQPPNHLASTATNRRKSSLLSYFFGGGENDDTSGKNNQSNNNNVLIPRIHGKRILDAETDVIPNDVQVLNHFDEDIYDLKKKLTQPELSILLDDLIRYFNEALSQAKYRSDSTSSSTNPLILQRDSVESGIVHLKGNRDIPAFLQAKELTKRLIRVNFDELYKKEDQEVYIKLSNILCMHASIELECEMKAIATLYAKRIAYNIGGKILTADDLNHILQ